MYCPKCGTENPDDVQLCRSCSWVLTSISITAQNPNAKTSGLAITSLVLGILSIFTFFLTAIPAIILGIVSIFKIEKSAGQLKGKGLAIAGIAVPSASLLFMVPAIMIGILMPALSRVRMIAQRQVCATNMASLGKAMLIYACDSDNMYPTASKWCDLLIEHAEPSEKEFRCPSACEGPCNYAMNKNIERLGAKAPPDMVLLFETKPGWNQCGGPDILSTDNHKGEGCNVLFNDGHVEFVKIKDINNLKWMAE
jgi:prepilin-type processing-associated H-X9-DG protein